MVYNGRSRIAAPRRMVGTDGPVWDRTAPALVQQSRLREGGRVDNQILPAAPVASAPPAAETSAEWVRIDEACRILGRRKSQVYALAQRGQLPTIRLGRAVLFSRRGLNALHEAATQAAIAQTVAQAVLPAPDAAGLPGSIDTLLIERLAQRLLPEYERVAITAAVAALRQVQLGQPGQPLTLGQPSQQGDRPAA